MPTTGELLVLDVDALQGRQRGRLVLGGDGGDGLAGEADAVDRDDRPVADGVSPVGSMSPRSAAVRTQTTPAMRSASDASMETIRA